MLGASIPVAGAARLLDVPEQEVRRLADAGSRWRLSGAGSVRRASRSSSPARRWAAVQPSENQATRQIRPFLGVRRCPVGRASFLGAYRSVS
jgi:hypothetical protein